MARGKRGHEEVDTYEEDDFIENDDGSAKKKTKKGLVGKGSKKIEEKSWELSQGKNPRRVGVSNFKDMTLVRIGEVYEKNGEYLPGKKGISLTISQYQALLEVIPKLTAHLETSGFEVGASSTKTDVDMEEETKPSKKTKPKKEKKKSNIEATSDEGEEDEDDDE